MFVVLLLCFVLPLEGTPPELVEALKKAPMDRTKEEWKLFDIKSLRLIATGVSVESQGSRDELAERLWDYYQDEITCTERPDRVRGGSRSIIHDEHSPDVARRPIGIGAIRRSTTTNESNPSRKRRSNSKQSQQKSSAGKKSATHSNESTSTMTDSNSNRAAGAPFNAEQEAEINRMFATYMSEHLQHQNTNSSQAAGGLYEHNTPGAEVIQISQPLMDSQSPWEVATRSQQAVNSNPRRAEMETAEMTRAQTSWSVGANRASHQMEANANLGQRNRELGSGININNRQFPFGNIGSDATNIPPAPEAVLRKIRQGEYVHLDHLLPGAASGGDNYTITFQADDTSPGTPALRVEPRKINGRKISNFMDWLAAWNTYLRIFLFYFPDRAQEMLFYQATITQLATLYGYAIWSPYDKAFRMQVAMSPSARWDRFNEELFTRHIRMSNRSAGFPRSIGGALRRGAERTCYTCQQPGHFSSSCPIRAQLAPVPAVLPTPFNAAHTSSSQHAMHSSAQPFPAPQRFSQPSSRRIPCQFFNNNRCNRQASQCSFDHRCSLCGGSHGAASCPSRHS